MTDLSAPTLATTHARVEAFGRAERHSRRVKRLKILVPLATIGVALLFGGYMWHSSPVSLAMTGDSSTFTNGQLVMANPKLEGFAKNGRPYLMTADRATQYVDKENRVVLEGINAKMPVDEENWAVVKAAAGVLDRVSNSLVIYPNVTVTTTNGMTAKLKSARIFLATGDIGSGDPVEIQFHNSRVVAGSLNISDDGKLLVFEKNVRMNIDPQQMKASEQASGGTDASN